MLKHSGTNLTAEGNEIQIKNKHLIKKDHKTISLVFYIEVSSYLVRWNHGCDVNPCKVCGVDCPYHEAWLDQSDLRQSGRSSETDK